MQNAAEKPIYKVVISKEARFDFEKTVCLHKMPAGEIKAELETYFSLISGSHIFWKERFTLKYLDEETGKMLLLFFKKGTRFGIMQIYEVSGVCEETDYDWELEEFGFIRLWLNSKLD